MLYLTILDVELILGYQSLYILEKSILRILFLGPWAQPMSILVQPDHLRYYL